jgi:hypothetical protein
MKASEPLLCPSFCDRENLTQSIYSHIPHTHTHSYSPPSLFHEWSVCLFESMKWAPTLSGLSEVFHQQKKKPGRGSFLLTARYYHKRNARENIDYLGGSCPGCG